MSKKMRPPIPWYGCHVFSIRSPFFASYCCCYLFCLYWFHFGCPSLPCLCDLPIGQDPFATCRTFLVLVSSFAHSVIPSLCWKSQLFKNSPPSLLCRSLQMFLNPISFTAPLSFALPLSSLAQLSCAFCKKSMKHRPSKARKKEKKTEPGLLVLLAGESATPIEVQTFPFLGVQRHHEDHTTVEPDIECEMSKMIYQTLPIQDLSIAIPSPSTKEAQIWFAMSFFGRLGFCIQVTWAGHYSS